MATDAPELLAWRGWIRGRRSCSLAGCARQLRLTIELLAVISLDMLRYPDTIEKLLATAYHPWHGGFGRDQV